MIVAVLIAGWLALAGLSTPLGHRILRRVTPRVQAVTLFLATVGIALIPASLAAVSLSRGLSEIPPIGSAFSRCGKLIVAIVSEPLVRPELTLSLALIASWTLAVALGSASAWRSQRSARSLARGGGSVLVVPGSESLAFTVGLLRPKVVVSKSLLGSIPPSMRDVIVAHESAHRRWFHPLFIFIVESLTRGLRFPPLLSMAEDFRLALEYAADEFASRKVGSRELVAETIARVAVTSLAAVSGFEGSTVARVHRLLNPPAKSRIPLVSAALVVGALTVVLFAGGHAAHCSDASLRAFGVTQCSMRM